MPVFVGSVRIGRGYGQPPAAVAISLWMPLGTKRMATVDTWGSIWGSIYKKIVDAPLTNLAVAGTNTNIRSTVQPELQIRYSDFGEPSPEFGMTVPWQLCTNKPIISPGTGLLMWGDNMVEVYGDFVWTEMVEE